jgi:hypothetical protein
MRHGILSGMTGVLGVGFTASNQSLNMDVDSSLFNPSEPKLLTISFLPQKKTTRLHYKDQLVDAV